MTKVLLAIYVFLYAISAVYVIPCRLHLCCRIVRPAYEDGIFHGGQQFSPSFQIYDGHPDWPGLSTVYQKDCFRIIHGEEIGVAEIAFLSADIGNCVTGNHFLSVPACGTILPCIININCQAYKASNQPDDIP